MTTRSKTGSLKSKTFSTITTDELEPSCFTQASKHEKWHKAIGEEIDALLSNGKWELVPKEQARNIVGCKWVYCIKKNSDGSIQRYKALLVTKEFH